MARDGVRDAPSPRDVAAMRAALVGCGMMGRAAAEAMTRRLDCERLLLVDVDGLAAEKLAAWLCDLDGDVSVEVVGLRQAVEAAEVVAVAAPWQATVAVSRACASARRPLASIARPVYAEVAAVGRGLRSAGVALLGPVGLEPGLVELLAREAVASLEVLHAVEIVCGGVPVAPRPPLRYLASFGGGQRLPIAPKAAYMVADASLGTVPRFSGVDSVEVSGLGTLEAYHDGMLPWLVDDPVLGRAGTITQKTLRWPGFAGTIRSLERLGLLSDEALDGVRSPREVVERVLAPSTAWVDGDADAVVARCVAHGLEGGRPVTVTVELRDRLDPRTGLSAMARTTGFTLAACAALLASRRVAGSGWLRPNEAIGAEDRAWLFSWLRAQGVTIERDCARAPGPRPTIATSGAPRGERRPAIRTGTLDAVAVGIGPSNLSLAALLEPVRDVAVRFLDRKERFTWHEGLMLPGSAVQVHWLKDLVSLVDPSSRFSFLSFLAVGNRLYRALNTRRTTVPRREFEQYYQWVASQLASLCFGVTAEAIDLERGDFEVRTSGGVLRTRNVVLGVGLEPRVPDVVRPLVDGDTVFHASCVVGRPRRYDGRRIAVAGGGQSGAEIVRYLLGDREFEPASLVWASRRANFAPLDDSPFTNEYFMPNYSGYFHSLGIDDRLTLVEHQRLASDGISSSLLLDIYRRLYDLEFLEGAERRCTLLPDTRLVGAVRTGEGIRVTWDSRGARSDDTVDMLICATGYEQALPACLAPLLPRIPLHDGRPAVRKDFSLDWEGPPDRRIYIQNGARHAFGIADPNLSLMAWRSATIANSLAGTDLYAVGDVSAAIDWSPTEDRRPVGERTGGNP